VPFATAIFDSSGLIRDGRWGETDFNSVRRRLWRPITLRVPETLEPAFGSLATLDPLEGAKVSAGLGRRRRDWRRRSINFSAEKKRQRAAPSGFDFAIDGWSLRR